MNLPKNIIGFAALFFVTFYYFKYHTNYQAYSFHWDKLLILIGIWALIFRLMYFVSEIKRKEFYITPLKVIGLMLFLIWGTGVVIFSFRDSAIYDDDRWAVEYERDRWELVDAGSEIPEGVLTVFKRGSKISGASNISVVFPEILHQSFRTIPVWQFGLNLAWTLIQVVAVWVLFLLFFHNLGSWALRQKEWTISGFFEATGVGMGLSMLIIFLLGVTSILKFIVVWPIFGILFLLSLPRVKPLLQYIWESKWVLWKKDAFVIFPIVVALGILLALNMLNILYPIPTSHDSVVAYHNTPNLLASAGTLISGVRAYNFELLSTLVLLIFKSKLLSISLNFLGALLAFGLLFDILRRVIRTKRALLLTTLFVSLPMVNFILYVDPKVDLILLFFSLLALRAALEKRYILTGLFLGIAFGIKYTALLFIATLFGFLTYQIVGGLGFLSVGFLFFGLLGFQNSIVPLAMLSRSMVLIISSASFLAGLLLFSILILRKKCSWNTLKPLWITGLAALFAFSPWLIKNGIELKTVNADILYGKQYPVLSEEKMIPPTENERCESPFDFVEFDQKTYVNHDEGFSLFFTPLWFSTINPARPNDQVSDMSFLFLGFLILMLITWRMEQERSGEEQKILFKNIAWATLFLSIFWLLSSYGIPWYGLPMLPALLLLYDRNWYRQKWPYAVVGLWLLASMMLRFGATFEEDSTLLFAGGLTDQKTFTEQRFEGFQDIAVMVNADPQKKVYVVDQYVTPFIERNDQRIYVDETLDAFFCYFYDANNEEKTLERLRQENIGFIAFTDKILRYVEKNNPEGHLHKNFQKFLALADKYLDKKAEYKQMTLYSIPEIP